MCVIDVLRKAGDAPGQKPVVVVFACVFAFVFAYVFVFVFAFVVAAVVVIVAVGVVCPEKCHHDPCAKFLVLGKPGSFGSPSQTNFAYQGLGR